MKIFSNGSKCLTVIGLVAISNMMTALVAAKPLAADSQASSRRDAVKQAMQHAWEGYRRYAFDSDELQPLSKTSTNNWGGWEMTILDSLDTLYVMGMMDEFVEAREKVNNIDFRNTATGGPISFFETTIRALGGLISAYDLSGDKIFLEQAQVLADSLSTAFRSKTGIPFKQIDINTGELYGQYTTLADAGTCQLEFGRLSSITKDPKYNKWAQTAYNALTSPSSALPGLHPDTIEVNTGAQSGSISFGAGSDSFYEYSLKQYVLFGRSSSKYRANYEAAIDSMKSYMLKTSSGNKEMLYVNIIDTDSQEQSTTFQHLACFLPGTLALGYHVLGREDDLAVAKGLMNTCYHMYVDTKTGLSPEAISFSDNSASGYNIVSASYYLRPETVESLMYMYRVTGDEMYREWGWDIFSAIEKYARTPVAYASYKNVQDTNASANWINEMNSFFLAETLKYLYLLFSPTDHISIDEYVFNTEAHPFRINS